MDIIFEVNMYKIDKIPVKTKIPIFISLASNFR